MRQSAANSFAKLVRDTPKLDSEDDPFVSARDATGRIYGSRV